MRFVRELVLISMLELLAFRNVAAEGGTGARHPKAKAEDTPTES